MARLFTNPKPKKKIRGLLVWAVPSIATSQDSDGPDGDADADDAAPPPSP